MILLNLPDLLVSKIHKCMGYVYLMYYDIPSAFAQSKYSVSICWLKNWPLWIQLALSLPGCKLQDNRHTSVLCTHPSWYLHLWEQYQACSRNLNI